MSERFKIQVVTCKSDVPNYLHVLDTTIDDTIVYVAYSMSEAENFVSMHSTKAETIHHVSMPCLPGFVALDTDERKSPSWAEVTCSACLKSRPAAPLAETGIAQTRTMLALVESVRATASARIAEDIETLRRAEDLKSRLNARLDRLSASLPAQNASDGPRSSLADPKQHAAARPVTSKPMPY